MFLITNTEDKTWRDIQWGPGITHEEDNPNFHFAVYDSPLVAAYLYPAYEEIENPHLWSCTGQYLSHRDGIRRKYFELTTHELLDFKFPTHEQRITYGIICAMNLVVVPVFCNWAINYLKGIDQTIETAHNVNEQLINQSEYAWCALPLLGAITLNAPTFAANAAHRAFVDTLESPDPLNLNQLAEICNLLPPKEIAEIL